MTATATKARKSKAKATEAEGPGRPASFPGVETAAFLVYIPKTTRRMIRDFAESQDIAINQAADRLIQRGYRELNRS